MRFTSKKIAIGVTGGIAAYKTCELIRELKKCGAEVRVAMSRAASEFVSELTLATLSEEPVFTSLFENEQTGTLHIDLARWCDVFVICPATANILAKTASGIADDIMTTTILATESKVIFCPAMNSVMWKKPVVFENVEKLKNRGYYFVGPEWGDLATRAEGSGWGRLAALESIMAEIERALFASEQLAGKKVIVTAGPTRAPIDPVRFITNHSSGKMGFALARAAKLKGAEVVLIAGPNTLSKPHDVKYIEIVSADELQKAILKEYKKADILLMAAAVSDYQAQTVSSKKIKKSATDFNLKLKKSPDILANLAKHKENRLHIGFAVETDDQEKNAKKKLDEKDLDLIVLNNPLEAGAAFGGDTNVASILSRDRRVEKLPKMSKEELAEIVLDRVVELLDAQCLRAVAV